MHHRAILGCITGLFLAFGLLVFVFVLGGGTAVETGAEPVLVNLFELRAETFVGLLRRVFDFQFLDGLSDLGFIAGVVSQGDAEELSHVPQHLNVEVVVFELAARGPQVTDFQGERIDQLEVLPHDDTTASLLLLLDVEVAALEAEHIGVLREKQRENALLQAIGSLVGAAVHEEVLASGVAVNIAVEEDVTRLERLAHHHLGGAVLGALLHAWGNPLTIQIEAAEAAPVVADDDSIRVEHWYDLKNEVVTQVLGVVIIAH